MAEFPELGKHCGLETCQRLDFTPFRCVDCEKHFCSDHRFEHACSNKKSAVVDPRSGESSSAPMKVFVCSAHGCHTAETTRIECTQCEKNYCLGHRYPESHGCGRKVEEPKKVPEELEKLASKEREARKAVSDAKQPTTSKEQKELSAEEQKKLDKIAMMKMKAQLKGSIRSDELMCLFVRTEDAKRQAVGVNKKWSVSRCLDTIMESLRISVENREDRKLYRLFPAGCAVSFDLSATISELAADMSTIDLMMGK